MSEWCRTGDISHRENIEALCSGIKKCRVEDKIMTDYMSKNGMGYDNTREYTINSYLNMFERMIAAKNLKYAVKKVYIAESDIELENELTIVVAEIKISLQKQTALFLFYIRNGKITKIKHLNHYTA